MSSSAEIALASKAWPFLEAQKILDRLKGEAPEKGYVLFETGYGPSGLPHIGTFAEVARTSMVRRAFAELSDIPTKLFAFSDDMDGLREERAYWIRSTERSWRRRGKRSRTAASIP